MMSNINNMPERIYAWDRDAVQPRAWADLPRPTRTEYVRADIYDHLKRSFDLLTRSPYNPANTKVDPAE